MKSQSEALLETMVEYLITEPRNYKVRQMVILHRAIQQYRTKYGVGQLYLVKRLAMRISLLEYPKKDNPERRDTLLTY